jgi:hypothetical protein
MSSVAGLEGKSSAHGLCEERGIFALAHLKFTLFDVFRNNNADHMISSCFDLKEKMDTITVSVVLLFWSKLISIKVLEIFFFFMSPLLIHIYSFFQRHATLQMKVTSLLIQKIKSKDWY